LTHPAAGMMADPDHDGLSNLLEFAFATAPSAAHASPVVHDFISHLGERYLFLEVPKNPLATHLTYLVEATSELANASGWTSAGLVVEVNTATRLRVRDHVPLSSGIPRFMRVRVFVTGSE
jgi:hypothetical protein